VAAFGRAWDRCYARWLLYFGRRGNFMEKYWILLMFGGPLVGVLALAAIVKYIEVWRAKSWLAASGRIVSSKSVDRRVQRPGVDNGTEVRNFADVTYEFKVDGKTRKGSRVSIGEDLGNVEVAETLIRYPAGADVTVYYNPNNPEQAVLERDPPKGAFGCLGFGIALLISGAVVAVDGLTWIDATLRGVLPNANNAPFVIGFSFFALCCGLMVLALGKQPADQPGAKQGLWILWLCAAVFTAAAYWFATTTGGKI
jgi:hypothetical protein